MIVLKKYKNIFLFLFVLLIVILSQYLHAFSRYFFGLYFLVPHRNFLPYFDLHIFFIFLSDAIPYFFISLFLFSFLRINSLFLY
jgi:hypothetical protein